MNRNEMLKYIEKYIVPNRPARLKFSRPNTKLKKLSKRIGKRVCSFDLLSGWTCPYACECRAWAEPVMYGDQEVYSAKDPTRRVVDGPLCRYRCYAAGQECMYYNTFAMRATNWWCLIKPRQDRIRMREMLLAAIPKRAQVVRIHSAGDFFSNTYFQAWLDVTKARPDLEFYGHTKSIPLIGKYKDQIPKNWRPTLSVGGTSHALNFPMSFPKSYVVSNWVEAGMARLLVDKDDYLAYTAQIDFALPVHGTQPAGTDAARAAYHNREKAK